VSLRRHIVVAFYNDGPCWTRTSDLGIKSPRRRTSSACVGFTNLLELAVFLGRQFIPVASA